MEIGPLLPGRIPGALITDRIRQQLQDGHQALTRLQDQISSGHRFFLPSDEPAAAVRTIGLQSLLERKTQMQSNVETSQSLLAATESALASISDALNKAKQLTSAGIGDSSTAGEKAGLALETQSLIRQVINAGNTTFRGRYLFGGSETEVPPFTLQDGNSVRYGGDCLSLESYIDLALAMSNNVDGHQGLGAVTEPVGADINPALIAQSLVRDLFRGRGVTPGQISITLSSPAVSQTIDLTQARTIGDIQAVIENAFPVGSVTVAINAAKNGLTLTPAAGTITIADLPGGQTASDMNIAGTALATIDSGDLEPRLTILTKLADLNGGTGIGPVAGNGLIITNGETTQTVDISSAVTVEDLLNLLRSPDLNLAVGINDAGNGLAISSRLSGVSFSIGENNGQNATLLGIRTLTAGTLLSSLNFGSGVPVNAGLPLAITRRDGSLANIDLAGALTVQDVINKINAFSPGNLVASLNSIGNGISLTDNSGVGPLSVDADEQGTALGLSGTEPGNNPAEPLIGRDVNLREVSGSLNVLVRLQKALETGNNSELVRVNALVDQELTRLTQARGDVGGRLKVLDDVGNRLKDEELHSRQALSTEYDTDLAQVLTELVTRQTAFEATLRAAAQTLQLSLANYL